MTFIEGARTIYGNLRVGSSVCRASSAPVARTSLEAFEASMEKKLYVCRATIEFFLVLTGEKLCTVKLFIPCRFPGDTLPRLLDIQSPFSVLVNGSVQVSHDVMLHGCEVTGDDVIKVEVVLLPYKLVNIRMDPDVSACNSL